MTGPRGGPNRMVQIKISTHEMQRTNAYRGSCGPINYGQTPHALGTHPDVALFNDVLFNDVLSRARVSPGVRIRRLHLLFLRLCAGRPPLTPHCAREPVLNYEY